MFKFCFRIPLLLTLVNIQQILGSFPYFNSHLSNKLPCLKKNENNHRQKLMSTNFKIDVSTLKLKFKLGSKVSNIIWYFTNTEKDHISILIKHPNDNKHELYVFF